MSAPTFVDSAKNTIGNIGTSISNAATSASDGITNLKASVNDNLSSFSSSEASTTGSADSGFLESNGLIAKFAFLVLIVVAFIFLMKIGIQIIGYFTSPNLNPYLINGQLSGDTSVIITQNPAIKTSIPIYRSNNQPKGIEFTWSSWLLYKLPQLPPNTTPKYQPVFVKGDGTQPTADFYSVNNGPGVYFGKDPNALNTIYILMDTVSDPSTSDTTKSTSQIIIPNIPIGKYFHLAIRCQNKYVDVYINGTIVYRTNLVNVPKQNYYDINVCGNGGFTGNLSNLRYFSYSLSVIEINSIVMSGPNLSTYTGAGSVGTGNSGSSYLSSSWYSNFLN